MQTMPGQSLKRSQRGTVRFVPPDSRATAPRQANIGWPLGLAILASVMALAVSLLDFPSRGKGQDMQTAPERRPRRLQRGKVTFVRRVVDEPLPEDAPPDSVAVVTERANLVWPLRLAIGVSVLALAVSLLDFALIIGAVPVPIPGLRSQDQGNAIDTATYSFELDTQGWAVREAATNAVSNDMHVFAGRGALEFQVTNLTTTHRAFVYTTQPAGAKPNTRVVAHIYVPAGGPLLLATIYALDKSWAWHNGPFPTLYPGQWTAVTYQIPPNTPTPIHELGVMIVGEDGVTPYSGPLYLDSVGVWNR